MKVFESYPYLHLLIKIQLERFRTNQEGGVIIDIGAFDGVNTIRMAREFGLATVYAIEPCPRNFKVLCNHSRKTKNIITSQLAISDINGRVNLFLAHKPKDERASSQSNSLFQEFVESKASNTTKPKETVRAITLVEFCKQKKIEHIRLLKMNCEGGEYKIFDDKTSFHIFDSVDIISLALHGKSPLFISKAYTQKKRNINAFLVGKGFGLVYGERLDELKVIPFSHISQVWVKMKQKKKK